MYTAISAIPATSVVAFETLTQIELNATAADNFYGSKVSQVLIVLGAPVQPEDYSFNIQFVCSRAFTTREDNSSCSVISLVDEFVWSRARCKCHHSHDLKT